jgi:hypothetical protein
VIPHQASRLCQGCTRRNGAHRPPQHRCHRNLRPCC